MTNPETQKDVAPYFQAQTIGKSLRDKWSKTDQDLLALAKENILKQLPPKLIAPICWHFQN